MSITEQQVAKLEARLRALEAVIQAAPDVFTQELFERVERRMDSRRYDHPLAVANEIPHVEVEELDSEALNEIWRQMKENPAT